MQLYRLENLTKAGEYRFEFYKHFVMRGPG
jgi:hypothetical protein